MSIIVTKLHRADHGELEARITVDGGDTIPVTRRHGSWMILGGGSMRELLPEFATELQKRARPFDIVVREKAKRRRPAASRPA